MNNHPIRVLVVEDDPTLEHFWEFILKKVDPRIAMSWADSADKASSLIDDHRSRHEEYSLVISDIYLMGGETGIDLWDMYKNRAWAPPFVMVSSLSTGQFLKTAGSGPHVPSYLQKPLDPAECIPMIEGLLKYSKASRENREAKGEATEGADKGFDPALERKLGVG